MRNNHKTTAAMKASTLGLIVAIALSAPAQAGPKRSAAPASSQGIWVAGGDVLGDGRPARASAQGQAPAKGRRMQQNGTTVATAGDVQAKHANRRATLLLPAVQKVQEPAQPQRAKLKQNGTTVASAGDVQAPKDGGEAALLLPAVQKVHEPAAPERAKTEQNGTTVATASEVAAPESE